MSNTAKRMSVSFIVPAAQAVDESIQRTGRSWVGAINHLVQVGAIVEREVAEGGQLYIRKADGTMERVHIV